MVKRYTTPIDIGATSSAYSNLGSSWAECWTGLCAARRVFVDGGTAIHAWPPGAPISAVDHFVEKDRRPVLSRRFAALETLVGEDLKPTVDAIFAANPGVRVTLMIASSSGDPGALSAMVDAEFAKDGPSEPMTDEVLRVLLGNDWTTPLNKALGRELPSVGIFGACASALVGISYASDRINAGLADVVVLVSLDILSRFAAVAFGRIGAASKTGITPYDMKRDGTTVGEGAVGLILARPGVFASDQVIGRVAGTGVYCDASHPVEPNPQGVASAIRIAMDQAGVTGADVTAVYWHGTGTKQNDKTESAVSDMIFGELSPPCTSTKGSLGHTMGASGGFNILAACNTFSTGLVPPVAGTDEPEYPNLDLVLQAPRSVKNGPILVTALGFGGINAATVLVPTESSAP